MEHRLAAIDDVRVPCHTPSCALASDGLCCYSNRSGSDMRHEACAQQMAVSDWHARKHLAVVELPLDQKRLDAVLCQRVSGAGTAGATADDGDAKGAIQSGAIADGLHLS